MTKGKEKPLEERLACSTSILFSQKQVLHSVTQKDSEHTMRYSHSKDSLRYHTNRIILPDTDVGGRTLRFVLTASTVAFAHSWLQQKGLSDTVRFVLEEKGRLWERESQVSPPRILNNGILKIIVIVVKLKGKACGDSQPLTESMAPLRKGSFGLLV